MPSRVLEAGRSAAIPSFVDTVTSDNISWISQRLRSARDMAHGDHSPYSDGAMSPSPREEGDTEKLLHSKTLGQSWKDDLERTLPDEGSPSKGRRALSFLSRWRWMLDTLLLLIILGLVIERQSQPRATSNSRIGEDITGFAPPITSQLTAFTPSTTYVPSNLSDIFVDPAVKLAWLNLVPMGLGYLDINRLDTPGKAKSLNNLPTPLTGYPANMTVFTTSVTHQLHCLYSILEDFAAAKSGIAAGHTHDARDEPAGPEDPGFHVQHCFEYLRQSIMCSGDLALEGDQTTFPDGSVGSDGWDAKHVCRDWTQIKDYLEANRADDEVWIV